MKTTNILYRYTLKKSLNIFDRFVAFDILFQCIYQFFLGNCKISGIICYKLVFENIYNDAFENISLFMSMLKFLVNCSENYILLNHIK